jgi:hypothetical protein
MVSTADGLRSVLSSEVAPQLDCYRVKRVEFYGAGCRGEGVALMRNLLQSLGCEGAEVVVDSDMVGACHAVSQGVAGVVCILGTGANSCYFNGVEIAWKVPSLGYILGDEGSGAWLGKRLLADVMQCRLPMPLCEAFRNRYKISDDEIVARIYHGEAPNRFLASFAPFLSENIEHREVAALVRDGFEGFFANNVSPYFDQSKSIFPEVLDAELPVHFVGSVAAAFEPILREVAHCRGIKVGKIVKSPLSLTAESQHSLSAE